MHKTCYIVLGVCNTTTLGNFQQGQPGTQGEKGEPGAPGYDGE